MFKKFNRIVNLCPFLFQTDLEYVLEVAKEIESRYSNHIDSGLLEIISPASSYYPDFEKLRITLGDTPERVKWRSKQNLDFAFLMSYAQPKGTFYVQLEDDILAKRNFITSMKQFAIEKSGSKVPWFVLDFCQLGFIGESRVRVGRSDLFRLLLFIIQASFSNQLNCHGSCSIFKCSSMTNLWIGSWITLS